MLHATARILQLGLRTECQQETFCRWRLLKSNKKNCWNRKKKDNKTSCQLLFKRSRLLWSSFQNRQFSVGWFALGMSAIYSPPPFVVALALGTTVSMLLLLAVPSSSPLIVSLGLASELEKLGVWWGGGLRENRRRKHYIIAFWASFYCIVVKKTILLTIHRGS